MLGDAGTSNTDLSYGGETGESVFSMQYYRNKAEEFQRVMNSLDIAARSAREVLSSGVSEDIADELQLLLNDFDSKKLLFRATAETINASSWVINEAGGRFPIMQIPQTLGIAFVVPAAGLAALATAATLIAWGITWLRGLNERLRDARLLSSIEDPEQRAVAAAAVLRARSAAEQANENPITSIAGIVKWGAIAALAFMGYKAYKAHWG